MTQLGNTLSASTLAEQLEKLVKNAQTIRSEPFQAFKGELFRKLLWLRPSVNVISAISCCGDTPQLGFSNISLGNLEKKIEKRLSPPRRPTPEKQLQSWLIQQALKSGGRLEVLEKVLGGQCWFVSDEIALKTSSEKVVADLLLVRVDSNGLASLVNAELKSTRSMETFRQVICFRAALEDAGLQEGWKKFAEIMIGKKFEWHPTQETRGLVIWPARKDSTNARANVKRGDYPRVDVIGYRHDPEVNGYALFFERVRLEKGTVMSEWQDENGQWWRSTVVADTTDVFKSVTVKVDAPDREIPRTGAPAATRE